MTKKRSIFKFIFEGNLKKKIKSSIPPLNKIKKKLNKRFVSKFNQFNVKLNLKYKF